MRIVTAVCKKASSKNEIMLNRVKNRKELSLPTYFHSIMMDISRIPGICPRNPTKIVKYGLRTFSFLRTAGRKRDDAK